MPNPERSTNLSSRSQDIATFAREEVERFRAGEINRVSSNEELRTRFGYTTRSSFYPTLRKAGLIEERRLIRKQGGVLKEGREGIFPSSEWAWMVGLLAGGGHVNINNGAILLTSSDDNLLNAYKSMGERLFGINSTSSTQRIQKDGKEYKAVKFFDRSLARRLGDLRRTEWYSTVLEEHKWILENPRYTWSFLGGFFEMRGGIVKPHIGIIFYSQYLGVTNAISELLVRVGVNKPIVLHSNYCKEGVRGVGILRGEDVRLFANNIHSKIPAKEEALEILRRRNLQGRSQRSRMPLESGQTSIKSDRARRLIMYMREEIERFKNGEIDKISSNGELASKFGYAHPNAVIKPIKKAGLFEERKLIREKPRTSKGYTVVSSNEDVLTEWRRLREALNRTPTSNDIRQMRKEGKTKYSVDVYLYRFGDGQRSFNRARENLERLAEERSRGSTDVELKPGEEVQIFPSES